MKNIAFKKLELSSWRKIAIGTWGPGGDPSVYGKMEIQADRLIDELKKSNLTITVAVARAVALTLQKYPAINGMIRFGNIYQRPNVQLFLQTTVDEHGKELSGVVIDNAEHKSMAQIQNELRDKSAAIREDRDPNFKKVKKQFKLLPSFVLKHLMHVISFLVYTLNLDLRFLGIPRDPFGSVMITSIGSIGLDEAYAPLIPYSKVPLLIAVGAVQKKAVVLKNDQLGVANIFSLCVTIDHRFIDGLYASKMAKTVRHLLETEDGLRELQKT